MGKKCQYCSCDVKSYLCDECLKLINAVRIVVGNFDGDIIHRILKDFNYKLNSYSDNALDLAAERIKKLQKENEQLRDIIYDTMFYSGDLLKDHNKIGYSLETDYNTYMTDVIYRRVKLFPTSKEALDYFLKTYYEQTNQQKEE